jgi:plasmid stabilization system protein ParE
MKVRWTELASAQLDEAMAYIARERPAVAARWLEHLLESADSLAEFPDKAPLADEAKRDDIRDLTVSPYRIIYRRDPNAVYITMVLHERQRFDVDDVQ